MDKQIRLRRREIDKTINLPSNIPSLLRRIYASRGIRSANELELSIKYILPWNQLDGIEKAINILYNILCTGERITIIGDFDTDGATSIALSILCLKAFGYNNVNYLVPNRFKNDYGLSPEIVHQAHAQGTQIILTVDNGISSHDGVDLARKLGIPVLITDHHLPGKTLPNAEVIINPNLHGSNFQSKYLSGVGVVFYLMLALRSILYDRGWFKYHNIIIPNLANYLDLVVLGTVVDAVPFDTNNRILIWQGLNRIRAGKCRPGIKALLELANKNYKMLATDDLSFVIGPRLNAAGRLDDMSISISLLLSNNLDEARKIANRLEIFNETRKKIEYIMHMEALDFCKKFKCKGVTLPKGLVIYNSKWHQGIVGILASRIKEQFYRPVIIFASVGDGLLKGSCRSIQGIHIHNVLEHFDILYPGIIINFGGHAMAAGLLLREIDLREFKFNFNKLIEELFDASLLCKEVISDGPLSPAEMTMEVALMLHNAGPWGQMFPEPLFDGRFRVLQKRIVGNNHLKVLVKPINGGPTLRGIAFNVDTEVWKKNNIQVIDLTYKLDVNEFYGNCSLQIIIDNIWFI